MSSRSRGTEYEDVLSDFDRLAEAVIDTSSLILAEKAAVLPLLADEVRLRTVPAAIREYSAGTPGGSVPPAVILIEDEFPDRGGPADSGVLAAARARRLPLISEDRKLLLQAGAAGLRYYNCLVMLEFLLYRGKMDDGARTGHRTALLAGARYASRVLAWADGLHWAVMKRRGI